MYNMGYMALSGSQNNCYFVKINKDMIKLCSDLTKVDESF